MHPHHPEFFWWYTRNNGRFYREGELAEKLTMRFTIFFFAVFLMASRDPRASDMVAASIRLFDAWSDLAMARHYGHISPLAQLGYRMIHDSQFS